MGAGLVDLLQIRNKIFLTTILRILRQHLAVAKNGIHRCAQLVTHVGKKLALRLVGGVSRVPGLFQLMGRVSQFQGGFLDPHADGLITPQQHGDEKHQHDAADDAGEQREAGQLARGTATEFLADGPDDAQVRTGTDGAGSHHMQCAGHIVAPYPLQFTIEEFAVQLQLHARGNIDIVESLDKRGVINQPHYNSIAKTVLNHQRHRREHAAIDFMGRPENQVTETCHGFINRRLYP